MNDMELLASLSRELELDNAQMGMSEGIIPAIISADALNELVQDRVLKGLANIHVGGGRDYQEAIRMSAMYLEAFVMGYRYRKEQELYSHKS